jgi:hypothetical protein
VSQLGWLILIDASADRHFNREKAPPRPFWQSEWKLPVILAPPNGAMIQTIANGVFEPMNFREVAAMLLAAVVMGVGIWAMIGPSPPEHTSRVSERQFAGPP